MQALSQLEIDAALATVPAWMRTGDCIRRDFEFEDFVEAFGFMTPGSAVGRARGPPSGVAQCLQSGCD